MRFLDGGPDELLGGPLPVGTNGPEALEKADRGEFCGEWIWGREEGEQGNGRWETER